MKEKLSVVILTRNEEKNIKDCLESVKWADEIIVVDDNSTDNTPLIAKEYTDKVIKHALNGDFSVQRNIGTDNSSGDWILQMDADERVTEELRNKINEILEKDTHFSAFRFKRLNNFCGKFMKYGGEDLHKPLRFFKKGKAKFSTIKNKIHEKLSVDGEIGEIDAYMEHYNFPSVGHYVSTQDKYAELEARQLLEEKGIISKKTLAHNLKIEPIKLFIKIYIKRKGYRDGFHGLVFAMLSAWRRFLIYAKYWELNKEKF